MAKSKVFEDNRISVNTNINPYAKKAVFVLIGDERKNEATEIIYGCLIVAGIEITDDVRKVVAGCVEAAVSALPKTHGEAA